MSQIEHSILKFSEVKSDSPSFRIDSEYFKSVYKKFYDLVDDYSPLSKYVKEGYRVVYETTTTFEEQKSDDDPYFLQATDIRTPFINRDNLLYVDKKDWIRYPKGRIKKGELLIEVKGKAEKVGIVPEDFPLNTLVTGSLYKLELKDTINKYFLLGYLVSKFGDSLKNRYKTNVHVNYISKGDLYRLPVPNFSSTFQRYIGNKIESAFNNFEKANKLYKKCHLLITSELGFDKWDYKSNNSIKSINDFFAHKRLDAEYFHPKYEEMASKLNSYGCKKLIDIFKLQKSLEPGSDYYRDSGIGFLRVKDFDKYEIMEPEVYLPRKIFDQEDYFPNKDEILFTKDGSVGIGYHLKKDAPFIPCSAILRLKKRKSYSNFDNNVLTLILNSPIVKKQAERDAGGSIIKHWRPKEIEEVSIPILPQKLHDKLATDVKKSFELRKTSRKILECCKRAITKCIEEDERKAVSFLNTKLDSQTSTRV